MIDFRRIENLRKHLFFVSIRLNLRRIFENCLRGKDQTRRIVVRRDKSIDVSKKSILGVISLNKVS